MRCTRIWRPLCSRQGALLRLETRSRKCPSGARSQAPVWIQKRHVGFETVQAVLVPPAVFGGLLITLWTYKCLMMVVFQNKIIYMPSVPPFSRSETVSDYAAQCRPVDWVERDLKAADGTALKLLEGSIGGAVDSEVTENVVVVYFQGNASSLPPRLPYLSNVLKALASERDSRKYTIIALSYRGYWKSKGSASQPGIELDAEATLEWVQARYGRGRTKMIVWGQSIGAGVASVSVSSFLRAEPATRQHFSGLILETPFVDLKAMLVALYPQRFLPYRYLTPFLRSTWDSKTALRRIGETGAKPKVLILEAGDDEIVPSGQAETLQRICQQMNLAVDRKVVAGTLHTEVMVKGGGRRHVVEFVRSI